jgi:outer membrane protein OmpA-like peptidoglycan-associated protein
VKNEEVSQEAQAPDTDEGALGEGFDELRRLLIAPEQGQLRDLSQRLDDPHQRAQDVSAVLPEAVALRPRGDRQLVAALTPAVGAAMRETLRRDPRGFAEVFFPLLGPAIRKAIGKALADMVQSLNQVVENTFTPKGIKWRMEAIRTGKPFAEVVLIHSLVYRVEEVFLVHRETGLLLQHAAAESSVVRDADLASAMLTAIRDFGRDTFEAQSDDSVEAFQFSDLSVWVEQGPHALLAAVIRGTASGDLRVVLQESLERIHLGHFSALEEFAGDTAVFDSTRDTLEECLQAKYAAEANKTSPLTWVILGIVALLLGVWALSSYLEARRWNAYQDRLRREPGIVLAQAERSGGKYVVTGLRDPRAVDPTAFAIEEGIDPADVEGHWEPYHSSYPPFAEERAKELLAPAAGVELHVANGVLSARGAAPAEWVEQATRLAVLVPGVTSFDATGVVDPELEALVTRIQARTVCFPLGVSTLPVDQASSLREVAADIRSLDDRARGLGRRVRLDLVGYADSPGTDDLNQRLSRERAENVVAALGVGMLRAVDITAAGAGVRSPQGAGVTPHDSDRCVAFRVEMIRTSSR